MDPIDRLARWLGLRKEGYRSCAVCGVTIAPGEGLRAADGSFCCSEDHLDEHVQSTAW